MFHPLSLSFVSPVPFLFLPRPTTPPEQVLSIKGVIVNVDRQVIAFKGRLSSCETGRRTLCIAEMLQTMICQPQLSFISLRFTYKYRAPSIH
jgi:hypothetical protein